MDINFRRGFEKVSGGPGSGVLEDNTVEIDILKTSPYISLGYRTAFLNANDPVYRNRDVNVSQIRYKGQENMVPSKVSKMLEIWEDVKDKPVDLMVDEKGEYHVIDGHHRVLAAIVSQKRIMKANIYRAPMQKGLFAAQRTLKQD